uniref:uncharacterized protein LOC120332059 n=1 Tax=Styela clava TaxID=7725 RepID=UPI00193A5735|nr:uncharacterized protein LOC120332059 [Styela clava]
MAPNKKYWLLNLLFVGVDFFHYASGQCIGTGEIIRTGRGAIQSPNYLDEQGKEAECSWKFVLPEKNYMLNLTIVYQRLYFVKDSNPHCIGSYILTINNVTRRCDKYINWPTYTVAESILFYNSDICDDATNPPQEGVAVCYVSDGGTTAGYIGSSIGFRIEYRFTECAEETTTKYDQQASTDPKHNPPVPTTKVGPPSTVATITTTEDTQAGATTECDIEGPTTRANPVETGSTREYFTSDSSPITDNDAIISIDTDGTNSDGISDTAKLFLVSIPGFVGIITLVATAIAFCRKKGDKSQDGNKVEQENGGSNQMENVESPIQELGQEAAEAAELDEATTSTIQEEESPYTIMYSAIARKDEEEDKKKSSCDEEKPSAIEDEQKHEMYSAVIRKTEGGDKETIHV